jgi:hypothetical protein
MTQAHNIISKFATANSAGISRLAKAIGCNRQTVHNWTKSGWIPPRRYADIIKAAKTLDVELTAEDFVDFEEDS